MYTNDMIRWTSWTLLPLYYVLLHTDPGCVLTLSTSSKNRFIPVSDIVTPLSYINNVGKSRRSMIRSHRWDKNAERVNKDEFSTSWTLYIKKERTSWTLSISLRLSLDIKQLYFSRDCVHTYLRVCTQSHFKVCVDVPREWFRSSWPSQVTRGWLSSYYFPCVPRTRRI